MKVSGQSLSWVDSEDIANSASAVLKRFDLTLWYHITVIRYKFAANARLIRTKDGICKISSELCLIKCFQRRSLEGIGCWLTMTMLSSFIWAILT